MTRPRDPQSHISPKYTRQLRKNTVYAENSLAIIRSNVQPCRHKLYDDDIYLSTPCTLALSFIQTVHSLAAQQSRVTTESNGSKRFHLDLFRIHRDRRLLAGFFDAGLGPAVEYRGSLLDCGKCTSSAAASGGRRPRKEMKQGQTHGSGPAFRGT
jgi:hypothetical protein